MEGPLSKWTNVMKGWQYRWFVLDDNAGLLSYYTSRDKMMRGARRGCVRLQDAVIGIDDEEDSTFTITVDQKMFHFQARDSEERKQWVCALEETILRHNQRKIQGPSVPSLDEFDMRLAEADAYLQLLIDNIKGIENKLNGMDCNDGGRQDVEGVLATAQEMVEAVKKSIVLLQLAKVAVTANQSTTSPPISAPSQNINSTSSGRPTTPIAKVPNGDQNGTELKYNSETGDTLADTGVSEARFPTDEILKKPPTVQVSSGLSDLSSLDRTSFSDPIVPVSVPNRNNLAPPSSTVPDVSFSSSEDENEFFDADEEISSFIDNRTKEAQKPAAEAVQAPENSNNVAQKHPEVQSSSPPAEATEKPALPSINDEDMYMKEESHGEKEGESLEEHKSVIMHLLSQVKLGMDLTKVVLPTFILEKRSLLEMYADFFSHADYFLEIARKPTAEERMIACVRFYLSTFGAGRNSSVAKKPYNPILGETFQCFWDHESFPCVTTPPVNVEDGPVPWAKSNQLSFLAEQVSHHPPVSAFYAEHKDQKISFNGHIWTKSKFLGLSVGVHNIGQGCVRLLEFGEEYILTFPNGYGRSILTVPWFELGGDCTITCEKTGYNAFVKFHTKPFYGGKIHKVTGEILAPNAKKPLCTLEGEWNSVIYCNYTSGKSERFVDVKRPKISKNVRKIVHQMPMESRRLWEVVTHNLINNKIDEATEAKRNLEEKQRSEAKERLENNIVYKPKYFHEDGCQNWIFNNMLDDRI